MDGKLRAIYEKQLKYYAAKDIDGLLKNNYSENAVLTMFDYQIKGHEALRNHFNGFFKIAGKITFKSTNKFVETENTILIEASAETEKLGAMVFIDAFVINNGKIDYQFSIVK
ncbi:nuclear transport factor 2 family protein [Candidatus Desantisbacteria bacterium]|nr:nuclear transport factor 2 family protein [Candidatus Desantisbacteria bacterium]